MDGLTLAAVVHELAPLEGGRIEKIQQPERDELLISIHSHTGNYRLLISASPENCRITLTDEKRVSPTEAPMFLMLMRKHLSGARILSITQPNMDRVVELLLETRNELCDTVRLRLICEIMGRHSNIILVDEEGLVVDAIRRVSPSVSTARLILPRVKYEYAPSKPKQNPLTASAEDFRSTVSEAFKPESVLCERYYGLSPTVARRLIDSFGYPEASADVIASSLFNFYSDFSKGIFSPCIVKGSGGSSLCTLPFIPDADHTRYESMSQAVNDFYRLRALEESVRRRTTQYERILKNAVQKLERKLSIYSAAISSEEDTERLRLFGELITANMYAVPSRVSSVILLDYYSDPPAPVEIPLDDKLSPADNAQRYYTKYRKAKQARSMALDMQQKVVDELSYLDSLMYTLTCCESESELNEIRSELIQAGYLHESGLNASGKKTPLKKQPASRPYRFTSRDGITILVGKNNRQNDALTLKTAMPDEIWLHTKDIHGSHVIICKNGDIPDDTLYDAAMLAAYYSKARGSSTVPVDYTNVKYVKKPSGSRPGMVIYTHQRTVYVTPTVEHINLLLK